MESSDLGLMEEDGDLEPQPRDRCFTWPLQPTSMASSMPSSTGSSSQTSDEKLHQLPPLPQLTGPTSSLNSSLPPLQLGHITIQSSSPNMTTIPTSSTTSMMTPTTATDSSATTTATKKPSKKKKTSTESLDSGTGSTASAAPSKKPNPWGEASYADLITQALLMAPGGRMKLSEIYQWFADNIAYFHERSNTEAAAGWKNSIRHNLSLHSRFMRIQNEGAGKSSWWVINPDAKPGKASRRRAQTMESANKVLERKRGRVRKKVEHLRSLGMTSGMTSPGSSQAGDENGSSEHFTDPLMNSFRGRSDSTLSNYSTPGSRLSPSVEEYESYWALNPGDNPPMSQAVSGDLLDMTGNMRLSASQLKTPPFAGPLPRVPSNGTHVMNIQSPPTGLPSLCRFNTPNVKRNASGLVKNIKMEPGMPFPYGGIPNPMLREALQHQQMGTYCAPYGLSPAFPNGPPNANAPTPVSQAGLPTDLTCEGSNWQPMDVQCDIDAVLRHELNVTGKIEFGNFDNL